MGDRRGETRLSKLELFSDIVHHARVTGEAHEEAGRYFKDRAPWDRFKQVREKWIDWHGFVTYLCNGCGQGDVEHDTLLELPCTHLVHRKCIQHNCCPLCKREVEEGEGIESPSMSQHPYEIILMTGARKGLANFDSFQEVNREFFRLTNELFKERAETIRLFEEGCRGDSESNDAFQYVAFALVIEFKQLLAQMRRVFSVWSVMKDGASVSSMFAQGSCSLNSVDMFNSMQAIPSLPIHYQMENKDLRMDNLLGMVLQAHQYGVSAQDGGVSRIIMQKQKGGWWWEVPQNPDVRTPVESLMIDLCKLSQEIKMFKLNNPGKVKDALLTYMSNGSDVMPRVTVCPFFVMYEVELSDGSKAAQGLVLPPPIVAQWGQKLTHLPDPFVGPPEDAMEFACQIMKLKGTEIGEGETITPVNFLGKRKFSYPYDCLKEDEGAVISTPWPVECELEVCQNGVKSIVDRNKWRINSKSMVEVDSDGEWSVIDVSSRQSEHSYCRLRPKGLPVLSEGFWGKTRVPELRGMFDSAGYEEGSLPTKFLEMFQEMMCVNIQQQTFTLDTFPSVVDSHGKVFEGRSRVDNHGGIRVWSDQMREFVDGSMEYEIKRVPQSEAFHANQCCGYPIVKMLKDQMFSLVQMFTIMAMHGRLLYPNTTDGSKVGLITYGASGTGKSTFKVPVETVVGRQKVGIISTDQQGQFNTAEAMKPHFVFLLCEDAQQGGDNSSFSAGVLQRLVSGESETCQVKNVQKHVTAYNTRNLIMTANQPITSILKKDRGAGVNYASTVAVLRRFIQIKFSNSKGGGQINTDMVKRHSINILMRYVWCYRLMVSFMQHNGRLKILDPINPPKWFPKSFAINIDVVNDDPIGSMLFGEDGILEVMGLKNMTGNIADESPVPGAICTGEPLQPHHVVSMDTVMKRIKRNRKKIDVNEVWQIVKAIKESGSDVSRKFVTKPVHYEPVDFEKNNIEKELKLVGVQFREAVSEKEGGELVG